MYLNAAHVSVPDGFMQRAGAGLRSRVSGLGCAGMSVYGIFPLCVCMGGGRGMYRHTHKADAIFLFFCVLNARHLMSSMPDPGQPIDATTYSIIPYVIWDN